ncbi:MAG TPA: type VI secretion system tip protein TssI/VgrG [Polyangia bacterium]|jgi:type VI secretion system secreted protein VgrG|nr:type VI secretion system tip protein TssI/VgrG [Polyangia bacterium]
MGRQFTYRLMVRKVSQDPDDFSPGVRIVTCRRTGPSDPRAARFRNYDRHGRDKKGTRAPHRIAKKGSPMASGLITVTPLAGNDLYFRSMTGDEEMGRPFEFIVDVLSKNPSMKLVEVLGQTMTVTVPTSVPDPRHFNGYVTRFSQIGTSGNYFVYRAVLHPWLWFLGQASDCRIFQNHSVPEIVKKIFRKYPTNLFQEPLEKPGEDYPPREYIVQYRETDLNFISRLLEEVGISYHFIHGPTNHTLVLTDSVAGRKREPGYEQVSLRALTDSGHTECLTSWHVTQEVKSAGYVLKDFDYLKAGAPLLSQRIPEADKNRHVMGEFYDYPGRYLTQEDGDKSAMIRLNEVQSYYETVAAAGPVRGIGTGNIFMLIDAPWSDATKEHLVVKAHYELRGQEIESGAKSDQDVFHCSLTLVESQLPFRPIRRSPRPVVQGPQTAIVVGPNKDDDNAEEIWTDNYGRVLVRFHWERLGKDKPNDPERTSDEQDNLAKPCFVRVASLWAGKQWGVQFTPRIGQEVIVEFLEGDPDRPIITGRVYNSVNMPPYPNDKKTQSGIKTHSTKGGGPNNFNEIRFEDKKGSEELFVQAEKDKKVNVKNDRGATIGANDSISVGGDRSVSVTGNLAVTVSGGGKSPNHSSHSVTGKYNLHASDTIEGDAPNHIKLTCGSSSILIEPNKITLMAGGKAFVVLDEHVLAQSSEASAIVLDANAFTKASTGAAVLLDANVLAQSKAVSQLLLDGNATLTSKADVKAGGANVEISGQQKVTANGGGAQLELAVAGATLSGSKVGISGQSTTEITGALVKIN